jgi:hypothetical protein
MKQQRAPPLLAGAVTPQYNSTRRVLYASQELSAASFSIFYRKNTISKIINTRFKEDLIKFHMNLKLEKLSLYGIISLYKEFIIT